jgi:putative FmdB family regulatory protein
VPTYQYACTDCADRLEVVQKFTDDPLTVCPSCGGKLRKIFSPVGIVFKGSGFYRTDSRPSQKSSEPAASSANGSDSKKSDSAKSEGSSSSSGDKSGGGDKKAGDKVGSGSSSSSSSSGSSGSSGSSDSKVA